MSNFKNIKVLEEFTNSGTTYGTYWVDFKGKNYLFIRTDKKIAIASHIFGELPDKSLNMLRDDVAVDFLETLEYKHKHSLEDIGTERKSYERD